MRAFAVACALVAGCRDLSSVHEAPEAVVGTTTSDSHARASVPFPLKAWMAANLARPMKAEDLRALAQALAVVAANAPPELPPWAPAAERGVAAALSGDIRGVRQSCNECHESCRARYRDDLRSRPFPQTDPIERSAR